LKEKPANPLICWFLALQNRTSNQCSSRLLVQTGLWEDEYYCLYNLDDSYDLAKQCIYFDITDVINTYRVELGAYGRYFNEFQKLY
jgi:hypothetical protein